MPSTVYLLLPLTASAQNWIDEHIEVESWQIFAGRAIAIEHGYVANLVAGMEADGLVAQKDFAIQS